MNLFGGLPRGQHILEFDALAVHYCEIKIDGKAILYPHIKQTQLQTVDYWDKAKEMDFLNCCLA